MTPDPAKARALVKMADRMRARIRATDVEEFPSQVLRDHYGLLHNLMEALAALEGVKTEGRGAHAELIDWTCETVDLAEAQRDFLHRLRQHRNRISYEGFFVDASFLSRNADKLDVLSDALREAVAERR